MHISFDFDYTLADSSGGTVACAGYALEQLGLPTPPAARIRKTVGLSLERTFEELTGGPPDSSDAARFKQLFLDHAEHEMLRHIHLYPGTVRALERLRDEGHHISIVSTKRKERIEEAIVRDGLVHLVDLVIGGECVKSNKPDPEGLLRAVRELGSSMESTVYVGDSVSDGECALRAGARFIALMSGQTSRAELVRWEPVALLDGVEQVPEFVITL